MDSRLRLLPPSSSSRLEPQHAHDPGQREPLDDEGRSTTQKARKTISERSGNGAPESVVSGIASAAASVTPPRIPAQPMKAMNCHGGVGSRSRRLRESQRGTYAIGKP